MARPAPTHVVCLTCHVGQEQPTKRTFLGFPSFVCEVCGAKSELPLGTVYVLIYVTSLVLAVLSVIGGRNAGCFAVLGIAAIPALVMHFRARRRLAEARANEKTRGARIADTFR